MVTTRLLVHAGARSNKKDDEQYVIQAEAYADLVSNSAFRRRKEASRHDDHAQEQRTLVTWRSPKRRLVNQVPKRHELPTENATTYVEDTQLAYTALESQLPTSSRISGTKTPVDTRSNDAFLGATTHTIDYAIVRGRKATPELITGPAPEVTPTRNAVLPFAQSTAPRSGRSLSWPGNARMSQSSYLVSPALGRSGKRKRLNEDKLPASKLRSVDVRAIAQNAVSSPSPVMRRRATQGADHEPSLIDPTGGSSELPTSYSVSDEALESLKRRQRLSQRSASDPGPQSLSSRGVSAQNMPLPRQNLCSTKSAARVPEQLNEVTAIGPADGSKKAIKLKVTTSDNGNVPDLRSLSLAIQHPTVAVGEQFSTHVTPALQRLAEGDIANCFKPTSNSRAIHDLERGHWRIVIPGWPFEQFAAFWQILERFIGSGDAGWGVWCTREQDTDLQRDTGPTRECSDTSTRFIGMEAGVVRIYCWGEVVKHIYLLLYVASISKVRKLGLQWLDSKGEAIVQMPGPKLSRSTLTGEVLLFVSDDE